MFGVVFSRATPTCAASLMPEDYEGHPPAPRLSRIGGEPVIFNLPTSRRYSRGAELSALAAGPSEYRPARAGASRFSARLGEQRPAGKHDDQPGPRRGTADASIFVRPAPPGHGTGLLRLLGDACAARIVPRPSSRSSGYVHTGIEKTAEDKSYWKVIPVIEAGWTYLTPTTSTATRSRLQSAPVENGSADGRGSPRAPSTCGVIHNGAQPDHGPTLVWLGTSRVGTSAAILDVLVLCLFRERSASRSTTLFEMSTGQRMHTRLLSRSAGVAEDVAGRLGGERSCAAFVKAACRAASTSTATCSTATRSCSPRPTDCPRQRARLDGRDACWSAGASPARLLLRGGRQPVGICAKAEPYSCLLATFDFQDPPWGHGSATKLRPFSPWRIGRDVRVR